MTDSGNGGGQPKVGRVITEYGLDGMADRLARRWRGEGDQRRSLRELADDFNRAVLTAAMRDAGLRPLDGEVENLYRLLTDDDVGGGQRTQAEAKLERNGIDPDRLRGDFVSHQAVHTYLRKHRGVEPADDGDGGGADRKARTIERTKGRLQTVAESTLDGLVADGEIELGDFDVLVAVQVYCDDCDRQFEVAELFERGGCDCDRP